MVVRLWGDHGSNWADNIEVLSVVGIHEYRTQAEKEEIRRCLRIYATEYIQDWGHVEVVCLWGYHSSNWTDNFEVFSVVGMDHHSVADEAVR